MAKKVENKKTDKKYVNPASTPWGKIIIFTLAILMCLSGLISLIYLLVQAAQNV